jgi:hypothetical protein
MGSETKEADRIVRMAWLSLPPAHQELLQAIGAAQWRVVDEPLGRAVDALLRSAGQPTLTRAGRTRLDLAMGAWIQALRIVLVCGAHPRLAELNSPTRARLIARIAWHEWGHALSLVRCTPDDVAAGPDLLDQAPDGVREAIRRGGYLSCEYTYELIAEVYALLMERRQQATGRPRWLSEDIYDLLKRTTGW